jgi:SAM-dependent methyltransferase
MGYSPVKHTLVRYFPRIFALIPRKRLAMFNLALPLVENKAGLEIGGPSPLFRRWNQPLPIYDHVGTLDNCDFARDTRWASHSREYLYSPRKKPGKTFFSEGFDLAEIAEGSYDFVLSCNNLEHMANPVKALKEWRRVTRQGGALVLVLPYYARTFDYRRQPTPVAHMLEDFERGTQEDDLTHLPEILELHDLRMDPGAGSFDQFRLRSLDNFKNRCLHHHVFDQNNSRELLEKVGMEVIAVERFSCHLFLLATF